MEKKEEDKLQEKKQENKEDHTHIDPNHFVHDTGHEPNYRKIVEHFGSNLISSDLIKRFELLTKKNVHHLIRREIFFAHRDFNLFLDNYEKGKPIYLYTGRGPSTDALHLGHLLPFMFTKWMQDVFKCPLVIQLTDDEKYFYQKSEDISDIDNFNKMAYDNARDIIACGFDPELTFIFTDTEYMPYMYKNVCRLQRMITYNQIKGIFGFDGSENTGKVAYPAIQGVPCIPDTFPHIFDSNNDVICLIPSAIDQDPYFRMTRDVAHRLKFPKPACIQAKFFPGLQGWNSKMSSSDPNSAIFLNDTQAQIKNKINKYAFSGGKTTAEEQKKYGADISVDIPYNYLRFFMESDEELADIAKKYSSGQMLSGEIKGILIKILQGIVGAHQEAKKNVTDEVIRAFMKIRPIKPKF